MSAYVDPLMHHGWRPIWAHGQAVKSCHLIADTREELEALARRIGMKPAWFQPGKLSPKTGQLMTLDHYDLTAARRAAAVMDGAVELDLRGFVKKMRELRSAINAREGCDA